MSPCVWEIAHNQSLESIHYKCIQPYTEIKTLIQELECFDETLKKHAFPNHDPMLAQLIFQFTYYDDSLENLKRALSLSSIQDRPEFFDLTAMNPDKMSQCQLCRHQCGNACNFCKIYTCEDCYGKKKREYSKIYVTKHKAKKRCFLSNPCKIC
jgi:hypothetical protein